MPHREYDAGSPEEWLCYAGSDLTLAETARSPGIMKETLCFHAQQAAEKALKAVLIKNNVEFPRTHNLRILLDKIPSGINLPADVEEASALTDYAVSARYPGDLEDVTEEDYAEALRMARAVLDWAKVTIEKVKHLPVDLPGSSLGHGKEE